MAKALSGIEVSIDNLQNSNALVLYKVGPVLVCSPTMPVESITIPPDLTLLPGTNDAQPGVFKSMHGMVRVVDLRVRFGVSITDKKSPGRIIISEVTGGYAGFWVDEIEDVISFPAKGWSQLPAHVPREVFSRALICDAGIRLYADLENLDKFKATGYLRSHIDNLKSAEIQLEKKEGREQEISVKTECIDEPVNEVSCVTVSAKNNIEKPHKSFDKTVDKTELKNSLSKAEEFNERNTSVRVSNADDKSHKFVDRNTRSINIKKTEGNEHKNVLQVPIVKSKKIENNSLYNKNIARNEAERKNAKNSLIAGSDVVSPEKIKNDVLTVAESNNGILWLSILLLGFLAASIYVIEFSDFLVDDIEVPSSVGISDQLIVDRNQFVSPDKNEDEYVPESKAIANYGNDKVDVSETEEGIVIIINDYEKEENAAYLDNIKLIDRDLNLKENILLGEAAENQLVDQEGFNSDIIVEEEKSYKSIDSGFYSGDEKTESLNISSEEISNKDIPEQKVSVEKSRVIKTRKNVHIVVDGDTLWHIARRYVNDPWKYPELARLSEIKDPDLIYPGQKVVIIYNTNK